VTDSTTLSLPAEFPSKRLVVPKVCAHAAGVISMIAKAIIAAFGFILKRGSVKESLVLHNVF
jgi:hypothetical protein